MTFIKTLKQRYSLSLIAFIYRWFRHKLIIIRRPKYNDAYIYCSGKGIEIGALSAPYRFRSKTKIDYADIMSAKEMRRILRQIPIPDLYPGKLVKPSIILRPPKYGFDMIGDNSVEFVYSSHVLEHTPNILFALKEYLRILKPNGVVYSVIPNKQFTYDNKRKVTSFNKIVHRFEKELLNYELDDALDVVLNTVNHPLYKNKDKSFAEKILNEKDGSHHYFVYDQSNVVKIIEFCQEKFHCELMYFRSEKSNIHFCLRKIE